MEECGVAVETVFNAEEIDPRAETSRSLATAALDDEMGTSLAGTSAALGEIAQTAAGDDVRGGIETLPESVGEAEREPPEQVGLLA